MTASEVVPFAGRMPLTEYRKRCADLRAIDGASKAESGGLADQALARLFVTPNWTQEELAREARRGSLRIACIPFDHTASD